MQEYLVFTAYCLLMFYIKKQAPSFILEVSATSSRVREIVCKDMADLTFDELQLVLNFTRWDIIIIIIICCFGMTDLKSW